MVGAPQNGMEYHPPLAVRVRAANPHVDHHRWMIGILLLLIAVSAVTGVVVALTMGQTTAALIIGLVAAAFFTRVGC
jgi:uncharacterized integral membrane protein